VSVLVAGSLHLDVVLRAPHLPSLDETVTGTAVDYVFGGKGGNQAVAAARMGADVRFVGRAGSDRFGDMIRETLGARGVDLAQLQRDPGASGMSAAIVNADGEYGAVIVSAANLNIEVARVFVPEGTTLVLLQNEIPEEINLAVAQKAKAAGARVWLNAAPARVLPDALIALVDLLIVNRIEAESYDTENGVSQSLTTLGADGVSYGGAHYPGHGVDVISAHGAGDMFVGALAAQVDSARNMEDAIGFAQAAAALHVASALGDREYLTPRSVAAFLAAQASR
jgi:ribokinase